MEWGTATAAFQIEGNNTTSDWAQWEQMCVLGANPGEHDASETVLDCQSQLDGPDAWTHYAQDFALAAQLGHNAARLGIEWAKIEPTPGTYDAAVIQHYHDVLDAAAREGLTVMVTLQHFTLPTWLHDITQPEEQRGGWPGLPGDAVGEAQVVSAFEAFAGDMAEEFGAKVDLWVTINEPLVSLLGGYLAGVFPPGEVLQLHKTVRGMYNMAYAHARAYDAIHARDKIDADGDGEAAAVSIAKHWRVFHPAHASPGAQQSADRLAFLNNRVFVDAVTQGRVDLNVDGDISDPGEGVDPALQHRLDWLGVNYYGRFMVYDSLVRFCETGPCTGNDEGIEVALLFEENSDPKRPHSDMGWEIYPEGLRQVLEEASSYQLPIRITENGVADATDTLRAGFIVSHLDRLLQARQKGADIRGYYHWSLIDNFEWAEGFGPRFGLLHVDYTSNDKTRTVTTGAEAYRAIIQAGAVTEEIESTYGRTE